MTIREAIIQGCGLLKNAGIETPSLDASLLLSHILDINRTALTAKGQDLLPEEALVLFHAFLDRRINGECIAYITGKKEFRNLEFFVNPSVLVPRPDTETLVEAALQIIGNGERADGNCIRVLDLCTGSGAVAIALKNERPDLEVWATDICAEALETAKKNAEKLLGCNKIRFHIGDLYKALPPIPHSLFPVPHSPLSAPCSPLFSLILSNPPYIPADEIQTLPAEVQNEPRLALDGGKSGLEIIERIIGEASSYLKRGGTLVLEADPRQMRKIENMLENLKFYDIITYKDISGQNRVIRGILE